MAAARIALFGGTFDPPHLGHVAIARAAADQFGLSEVLFAPVGLQPLKPTGAATSFADRTAMVACACEADQRFVASDLDAPSANGEPNYTYRSLERLREMRPGAEVFNLVGADSFRGIAHWREPARLIAAAEWIVVSRPGSPLVMPPDLKLTAPQWERIHLLDTVHEDISATELRTRLRAGESCRDLLPPAVVDYILQHGLYR